jgi:hypothetical protein
VARKGAFLVSVGLLVLSGCGRAEPVHESSDALAEAESDGSMGGVEDAPGEGTASVVYCDERNGVVDAEAPDAQAAVYACSSESVCCQSGGVPGWACRPAAVCH